MKLLTEKQRRRLIENAVDCIMEDLDNYYYDELLLKAKKEQLIKFFNQSLEL